MNEIPNKYRVVFFVIFAAVVLTVLVVAISKRKPKVEPEGYSYSTSSNNVLLTDINGNMSTYATKKGTLLMTDDTGAMKSLPFPKGMIMMWNGTVADIPTGWVVCDGASTYVDISGATKTVPDLSGRFALGAGAGDGLTVRIPRQKEGAETVTLTKEQMPAHTHNLNSEYKVLSPSAYSRGLDSGNYDGVDNSGNAIAKLSAFNTSSTGGDQPHNNMPPYYVLCYICYTGVGLA